MYSSSFLLFYPYILFHLNLFIVPKANPYHILHPNRAFKDAIPTIEDHNVRKKRAYRKRESRLGRTS